MSKREYTGTDLIVLFDLEVCTHCGNCLDGLPEVFDLGSKPWIQVDRASRQEVVDQVNKCPSGALAIK